MARFGQGFIQSLTQPSYSQGLFELGRQIGSAPAMAREKEEKQNLIKSMLTQSPIQQARTLQQEAVKKGDLQTALKAQQLEQQTLQSGATKGINALLAQIANPKTNQEMVNRSRQTITQLARNNQLDEYDIMSKVSAAEKSREAAFSGNANLMIDRQLAVINTSADADEIAQAQKNIIDIGNKYGIEYSKYSDAAQKRFKQINDANWELNQRARTAQQEQEQMFVDRLSNQAEQQADPVAFIDANLPQEFSYLRNDIIKTTNEIIKESDSANQVSQSGKVSKENINFLKNNPSLFENNPGLEAAYKTYTSGKSSPSIIRSAAKSLTSAVIAEKSRQRKLETSKNFAKENADNAVNFILNKKQSVKIADQNGNIAEQELPSGTGMFESPDLYNAVEDVVNDEDLNSEFRNRMSNVYQLNPKANPIDAAKQALNDMQIDYSGQYLTDKRRRDLESQASDLEQSIQAYYEDNGINFSELSPEEQQKQRALAEIAVQNIFEKTIEQERKERMQRVQDIRSQVPSRGQINNFR